MSTHRIAPEAGYVDPNKLEKGPNGRPLCRECKTEVRPGRRSFCADLCVKKWKIKTDPAYVRGLVFIRDKGVCRKCGLDTEELIKNLNSLTPEERNQEIESLGIPKHRKTLWDCDHIVEVASGGGGSGLENFQTLCFFCHKSKTAKFNSSRGKKKADE